MSVQAKGFLLGDMITNHAHHDQQQSILLQWLSMLFHSFQCFLYCFSMLLPRFFIACFNDFSMLFCVFSLLVIAFQCFPKLFHTFTVLLRCFFNAVFMLFCAFPCVLLLFNAFHGFSILFLCFFFAFRCFPCFSWLVHAFTMFFNVFQCFSLRKQICFILNNISYNETCMVFIKQMLLF